MKPVATKPLATKPFDGAIRLKGYGLAVLAATCFAAMAIFGKLLLGKGLSPVAMLAWQLPLATLAALVALLALRAKGHQAQKGQQGQRGQRQQSLIPQVPKETLGYLALQGTVGSAATIFFSYKALETLPASLATLLFFLYPVLVVFVFALFGIKKIPWHSYLVVVTVIFGATLALDLSSQLASGASLHWQGMAYALLSALCYGIYHVLGEVKLKALEPLTTTFYTLLFGSAAALVLLGITALGPVMALGSASAPALSAGAGLDLQALMMLLMVAVVSNLLPIYLLYRAIALIGADQVAILSTLELPITLALALLVLKERLMPSQWLGVVVIIVAIYFLHKMEAKPWKT